MRRRSVLARILIAGLGLVSALLIGPGLPGLAADTVCPKCGAPLDPGAAFCGSCGQRVNAQPAPAQLAGPAPGSAVVQIVAACDAELTSTLASLAFESNLRVDSILGSAFAIAPGEFITDSGLLVGARSVSLRTASGRSIQARTIGTDPMVGIALLAADIPEIGALVLRDDPPRMGEPLRALGFPSTARSGGNPVLSNGVVSGLHRGAVRIHAIEDYLQTDASLPDGLAGGPMIDSEGRVIGMSTGLVLGSRVSLGPQSGIGFAVPAAWIKKSIAWIRSGAPPRSWVGAYAIAADAEARERFKLPLQTKLCIDQVFPGSPAADAGLRRGDGLLKVQGEEVGGLVLLQERLLAAGAGDSLTFTIARDGGILEIPLRPVPRPDKPKLAGIDALRFFADLEVAPGGDDRLVVTFVASGSEPALNRIARGDVLQSILSKKDWEHGARDNSRWRSVRSVADLETRLATAYSDFDFCLGLRFRARDGTRREMLIWTILTPTAAL